VAHGADLRSEVGETEGADELVQAIMTDYRDARLSDADRGMLDFAMKLTREPSGMRREDVERLRSLGFDDPAIHDIVQVVALFNYYNRLADGLGIDLEPGMPPASGR